LNIQRVIDGYAYLFARKRFFRINKLLHQVSLRGIGILNYKNDVISGEQNFLRKLLHKVPRPIVFDVGANVGSYTSAVLAENPDAQIFAFEPHPATFAKMSANLISSNAQLFNVACGKESGEMILYDYSTAGSEHASLYQEVIEQLHHQDARAHTIRIIDLDTFVEDHKIQRIDLLKIDTEGHELAVLEGAHRLLKARQISAIQFEFNEMNVISRTFFRDFYSALPEYRLYRMVRDGLIPISEYSSGLCEIFLFQNIVALLNKDANVE
jgi:FkbM family methyltransferase